MKYKYYLRDTKSPRKLEKDFKRSFDDICSCCHSHLLIPVPNNSNTIRLQAPKSELEEKNISICWLDYSKSDFFDLPPVHLELRISPRIFEKNWNDLNRILRGLGETDSWKKTWTRKSRGTVDNHMSLYYLYFIPYSHAQNFCSESTVLNVLERTWPSRLLVIWPLPLPQPFNPIIQYSLPLDKHSMNPSVVEASYMPY